MSGTKLSTPSTQRAKKLAAKDQLRNFKGGSKLPPSSDIPVTSPAKSKAGKKQDEEEGSEDGDDAVHSVTVDDFGGRRGKDDDGDDDGGDGSDDGGDDGGDDWNDHEDESEDDAPRENEKRKLPKDPQLRLIARLASRVPMETEMVLPPSPVLLLNPVGFIFWVAKILRYQLQGRKLPRQACFQEFCTRHGYYFRSAMAVFVQNRLEDGKQENLFNDLINRVYFAVAVLVYEDVESAYFQLVVTNLLEDIRDDHHTLTLPIIARLFGKSTPQSYVTKLVKLTSRDEVIERLGFSKPPKGSWPELEGSQRQRSTKTANNASAQRRMKAKRETAPKKKKKRF